VSLQLSEVNIFQHDILGPWTGVFSGIGDVMRGVEYALQKGTEVGAGPEQSCAGISIRYLRDLLNLNTIRRRLITHQELLKHSMRDVPYYYAYIQISPSQSKTLPLCVSINA
jgi:hypothetical protein